jgi:hypothetical protein
MLKWESFSGYFFPGKSSVFIPVLLPFLYADRAQAQPGCFSEA